MTSLMVMLSGGYRVSWLAGWLAGWLKFAFSDLILTTRDDSLMAFY